MDIEWTVVILIAVAAVASCALFALVWTGEKRRATAESEAAWLQEKANELVERDNAERERQGRLAIYTYGSAKDGYRFRVLDKYALCDGLTKSLAAATVAQRIREGFATESEALDTARTMVGQHVDAVVNIDRGKGLVSLVEPNGRVYEQSL